MGNIYICLFEILVKVEGAADARVGDHRAEDLRTVDLLALPPLYYIVGFEKLVYLSVIFSQR